MRFISMTMWAMVSASAQVAVPVAQEGHHHLIYEDANVRAYYAEIPPRKATLLHQHDHDYLWVGLGYGEITTQVQGKAPDRVISTDGALHFARGGFAHVAADSTAKPFRNIDLELMRMQTNPRNRCSAVLQGEVMSCRDDPSDWKGAMERPSFETDQTRVSVVRIGAHGKVTGPVSKNARLLVPLEGTELEVNGRKLKGGEVLPVAAGAGCEVRNSKKTDARVMVLEFR